jgi:hypothetical protein
MPDFLNKIKQNLRQKGQIVIHCKITPNASRSEFKKIMANGVLKIAIAAVPERDKANRELINFLSKELGVVKSNIEIISGGAMRNKLVKIKLFEP